MVFSTLFGKKRDRDQTEGPSKPGPAASPAPSGTAGESAKDPSGLGAPTMAPLVGPSGPRTPAPANAREVARATAEKIDKIESEMSLDFNRSSVPNKPQSGPPATAQQARPMAPPPATPGPTVPARKRGRRADGTSTTLPSLGQTTDILLGDSILANAMELTDSASSPAIEEAAILYANGQPLPAVSVLSDAIKGDRAGHANTQAWLMLFELYQVLGKRAEFENLAIDYAVCFETSAPTWSDLAPVRSPAASTGPVASSRAAVTFRGNLGSGIVTQLDQLKRLAQKNPVLYLDFGPVTAVEASGADLILRVFAAFQKSNHEVVIEGAEAFAERLLASVEVGRRDASNATWMLLLEMYRVLGRQAAFEETSIDYCVTYEVSPPSWETPSPKFRLGSAASAAPAEAKIEPAAIMPELAVDMVSLSGDLLGKAEAELARLTNFAAEHRKVVVDCKGLRRVDFTAAGVLLNWAVGAQGASKTIELRDVSNLIAALLVVMGLHEVAQIERRKL